MPLKPGAGETPLPPPIPLGDAGLAWQREDGELVITRAPSVLGAVGPLLLGGMLALVVAMIAREAWVYVVILALGFVFTLPVVLLAVTTRFTVHVTRDGVAWEQSKPFERHGKWTRARA